LIITRRAFTSMLSLTGLAALAGFSPLRFISDAMIPEAMAQAAAGDVAKPVSLPDMALGPKDAAVTITEYASMTCPHCAAFNETVFPKIKSEYIDTGKVRYIFREFPLDDIALAASAMARCVAGDDAPKYFALVDTLFRTQNDLVSAPLATINRIGKQAGSSEQAIKICVDDDPSIRQKIVADLKYAHEVLKVGSTPAFFINGEKVKGGASFEDFDKLIKPLLKS
jgi:protein-disulfide isomerase